MSNYIEQRPWGKFENLLDEDYCKVKRITVSPGGQPSYQYHHHRSEVWTIVKGAATVTLNGEIIKYNEGEVVFVPQGAKHRVKNNEKEDLIFIEVQTGTYFGEDDIVRIEDDYGRTSV